MRERWESKGEMELLMSQASMPTSQKRFVFYLFNIGFYIKISLGKKNSAAKEIFETTGLDQGFPNLVVQKND